MTNLSARAEVGEDAAVLLDWRCRHCGRLRSNADRNGSTKCAPPFRVQEHQFDGHHPSDLRLAAIARSIDDER